MCEQGIRGRHTVTTDFTHALPVAEHRLNRAFNPSRRIRSGIHRSDRGSQSASQLFQDKLTDYGIICSISRTGNGCDNAPTESWFNRFKHERVFGEYVGTRAEMTTMTFEVFDNRKRLHSTLGETSPVQFLKDWISTQQGEKQVA